jgi:hypothetical protein
MKEVKNKLLIQFITIMAGVFIIVFLGEGGVIPTGIIEDEGKVTEFYLTTSMELITMASIFCALRMFKFKKVHEDLMTNKEVALYKWGTVRMSLLEFPMLINGILYYLFMQTSFGYMGIILLLCMPFVFPTMDKCIAETSEEKKLPSEEEQKEDADKIK